THTHTHTHTQCVSTVPCFWHLGSAVELKRSKPKAHKPHIFSLQIAHAKIPRTSSCLPCFKLAIRKSKLCTSSWHRGSVLHGIEALFFKLKGSKGSARRQWGKEVDTCALATFKSGSFLVGWESGNKGEELTFFLSELV
ncbi:hypothetical protein GOP47_0025230, partial [Adiantum capillus-veneris]